MRLNKLTLNNIRSYDQETVVFPDGVSLLSGDIGSGKTSVLLGAEFALFGFIRGSFSGSSLLRHGADRGSVTLSFTVGDTDVTVHRELKRSSRGVRQDTGWYEVNGEREEATAREIKATVIEVLGYPSSLVTKSKNMLYRYTVYTPQEAMKDILRESADDRLEKIRKVLRLDKYRRVKDNVKTYARELRRSMKNDESRLEDRESLVDDIESYRERVDALSDKQASLQSSKEDVLERIEEVNDELSSYEEERQQLTSYREQLKSVTKQIKQAEDDAETIRDDVERKEAERDKDIDEPDEPDEDKTEAEDVVEEADRRLDELREVQRKLRSQLDLIESKTDDAEELKERISDLDTCPTCGQDVDDEHVDKVRSEQEDKIQSYEEKYERIEAKLDTVGENIEALEDRREHAEEVLEAWEEYEKQKEIVAEKKKQVEKAAKEVSVLEKRYEEKKRDVRDLVEERSGLVEELSGYDEVTERIESLQEKKESLTEKHDDVTSSIARAEEKMKNAETRLEEAEEALDEHDEAVESIQRRRTTHTWITEHFTNLLDVIEQHVLLTVHQQFDESFRSFFNDLIEDENLLADIDNEFTPRVTQQGFEMDIEDLSGGEKTSVALAYRLAMNDVINDYMDDIRTDDLIVLDEPTDGFSGEQLDRLRDILNELHASQILLVSHEEKLEGVTENLIKVRKTNNTSQIVS